MKKLLLISLILCVLLVGCNSENASVGNLETQNKQSESTTLSETSIIYQQLEEADAGLVIIDWEKEWENFKPTIKMFSYLDNSGNPVISFWLPGKNAKKELSEFRSMCTTLLFQHSDILFGVSNKAFTFQAYDTIHNNGPAIIWADPYNFCEKNVSSLSGFIFYDEQANEMKDTTPGIYQDAYTQLTQENLTSLTVDEIIKRNLPEKNLLEIEYYTTRTQYLRGYAIRDFIEQSQKQILDFDTEGTLGFNLILLWDKSPNITTILKSNDAINQHLSPWEKDSDYAKQSLLFGIVWFDKNGDRIMSELVKTHQETGEVSRSRTFFNGYSQPE